MPENSRIEKFCCHLGVTLRRLIPVIFSLLHNLSLAQPGDRPIDLFQLDDEYLYWQRVYLVKGSADSLASVVAQMLKSRDFVHGLVRNEVGFHGEMQNYEVDCRRYGRSYFNTPKIYCDGVWDGKFIVEVRDDFYRVTVYSLYFERAVPRAANPREVERKRESYRSLVIHRNGTEFKRSERSNLALMSLSLRDQFELSEGASFPRPKTGP